jgi:hypothetical protein
MSNSSKKTAASRESEFRILCPTGHLSYTRLEADSFQLGLKRMPHAICADAGSCDPGPFPLGADESGSPEEWQEHDLEHMLLASRRLNVPMVVGSANDTGSNHGVDKFVRIIQRIAKKHGLKPFKLAAIHHQLDKKRLLAELDRGTRIEGLGGFADLTQADIEATTNLVPVMGVEPIVRALEQGADVVITARTSDCCIFAAPAIHAGISRDLAYYTGKVMECASFCAEPYMAKESILGTLESGALRIEPLHPKQRCTTASVASHAMYEREDPYRETVAGGYIDMSECRYTQHDERTTRVTGSRFVPSPEYRVKIEGAGKVGERCYIVAGMRDPQNIQRLDAAIAWSMGMIRQQFTLGDKYQVHYHIYGRNGVMGPLETIDRIASHEVGIVTEAVAPTLAEADILVKLAARSLFYARIETKGTAGGAAYLTEDALNGKSVYRWTINHVMTVADPYELFPIEMIHVG